MFGIGYQEMFIVLVVAMVIFGPSRLPELAGQVGRWVRDFRRMSSDLTGEFEKTFAEVDEVKKSFKRELNAIQDEVEGVGKSARGDLKKSPAKTTAARKPAALGAGKTATAKATSGTSAKTSSLLGKRDKSANGSQTMATKADPLVDVSFFDASFVATTNGANGKAKGRVAADEDALSRVRRRRAAAAYARQATA
jgi:Tat protein translocase TatB subunit